MENPPSARYNTRAMKTVLSRQDFADALSAIASIAGGRTTKPILGCVRIQAQQDTVELSATDGEAGLRLQLPVITASRPGEVVLQADRLLSIVREMNDVEITLESDDKACTIRGAGSDFKVYVANPADFPPVPTFDSDPDLAVDGLLLRRMIAVTIYAAARELSRYAINGVLWEKQGKRLFLVATDGRRLARAGGSIRSAGSADFEVIVPAKALSVLERVFVPPKDGDEWRIDVKVTPNQVLLRSGDRVLSTVLVEGHFPKYQDVIPKAGDKTARLDRGEFQAAVRKAALLTTEESRAVRLEFSGEKLIVRASAPEQGEARVEIPIQYTGDPLEIGFNPNFLHDCLRSLAADEVQLELSENFRPGVLTTGDRNEFLYVIMPVSLNT